MRPIDQAKDRALMLYVYKLVEDALDGLIKFHAPHYTEIFTMFVDVAINCCDCLDVPLKTCIKLGREYFEKNTSFDYDMRTGMTNYIRSHL